jgi:hypothetical protein
MVVIWLWPAENCDDIDSDEAACRTGCNKRYLEKYAIHVWWFAQLPGNKFPLNWFGFM